MASEGKTKVSKVSTSPIPSGQDVHGIKNRELLTRIDILEKENEDLKRKLGIYSIPQVISGVYSTKNGDYAFVDGHREIRDSIYGVLSTEILLAKVNDQEPSKELASRYLTTTSLDKEKAKEVLNRLIAVGYGYFQPTKDKK